MVEIVGKDKLNRYIAKTKIAPQGPESGNGNGEDDGRSSVPTIAGQRFSKAQASRRANSISERRAVARQRQRRRWVQVVHAVRRACLPCFVRQVPFLNVPC